MVPQDLKHRHNTESHANQETPTNMDEENAEAEYEHHNNRLDEQNSKDDNANRVQRSAELLFGLVIFGIGLVSEFAGITPYQRPIPAKALQNGDFFFNLTNNEQLRGVTVPDYMLIVLSVVVPLLMQLGLTWKTNRHKTLCVYLTAVGITIILTNSIKFYTGYLRPTFLQGCEPDGNYETCTSGEDRQLRLSFPSGHASISFCGLCVFSFYLEHRYGASASRVLLFKKESGELIMSYKQRSPYVRILSVLCYLPVLLATFIATSRIHDDVHFPADVVGGALLGASVAAFVHQIWYPNFPAVETISREVSN